MKHPLHSTAWCGVFLSVVVGAGHLSAQSIQTALQPFVDRQVLAGAVGCVASKDKILDVETVGFADIAAKKPMATNAIFWIASMSKPMTGAALMMLVDEGKVRLDDPVEKYLPEFQGMMRCAERDGDHVVLRKPSHPITVREILSHTSGLPFSSPMEQPTLDGLPLAEAVQSYAMGALVFEPGTQYQYSNEGLNTAGRIIEVVSGMPYEEFMNRRLFGPLDMVDTTFWPNQAQVERLAKSYKPNKDGTGLEETTVGQLHYPLNDRLRRHPMPAGGLFSTAQDVARFAQMILNGGALEGRRYLSEESVKVMTSKQTAESIKDGYGLGWAVSRDWCGHGGAFATNLSIDRQKGLVTVWMVQHAGFPGDGGKAQEVFHSLALSQFGSK